MAAAAGQDGVVPTLTAESLVAGVPELGQIAELSATTLSKLPGASLTPRDVVQAIDWARREVSAGAEGAVIAQGTDTLEETAYLAGLYWDLPEPLVFTGAMRSPGQPSADGPANLIAACQAAGDAALRASGVLLVMNGDIHSPAAVRKEHSVALQAFESPGTGPIGSLIEGEVRLHHTPAPPQRIALPADDPYVPLLETFLADDGRTLRLLREGGADGVVVSAFGAGHVSMALAAEIEKTASLMPVVVSSRTRAGGTLQRTYGFDGSEIDLQRRGAILSGRLDARKSRLLLWACLAARTPATQIGSEFARANALTTAHQH